MKTYPYNRSSAEGERIFRLMDSQFNRGQLDSNMADGEPKSFQGYIVNGEMQCRIRSVDFLFPSNLAGFKRPQIKVKGDVEQGWGDFADQVSSVDFTKHKQELPISYTLPLNDESLKLLIDAGLYADNDFEKVFGTILKDELFNVEGDMTIYHLDVPLEEDADYPLLLVDPVTIVYDDVSNSESSAHSSMNPIVQWGAHRMIDLRRRGASPEEMVNDTYREIVHITPNATETSEVQDENTVYSSVLERPVDITRTLSDIIRSNSTEDQIQHIKKEQRALEYSEGTLDRDEEESSRTSNQVHNTIVNNDHKDDWER